MRALHGRRAKCVLHDGSKKAISKRAGLPALYVMLSTLLPSKNQSSRTGKSWAKDVLKITFQGLETSKPRELGASPPSAALLSPSASQGAPSGSAPPAAVEPRQPDGGEDAIMVAQGHMETVMPAGLLVKQHVDKDIAFHPSTGAFAFRLQARIGESVLTPLVERLQRVERLVDFVQAINAHPTTLHCESVSLSRLIFSYVYTQILTPNQPPTDSPRYQATVDFSGTTSKLELQLQAGNPHIRILDYLTKILDSSLGLHGLATILPLTLPVLRALDAAEDAWCALDTRSEMQIFCRASDWYTVRYLLQPPPDAENSDSITAAQQEAPKRITFEIRLRRRGNAPWWCIRRDRPHGAASTDQIDLALKKSVWNGGEKGVWIGMQCAAIAEVGGAESMVSQVDAVMREIATDSQALAGVGLGLMGVEGLEGGSVKGGEELRGQGIVQPQQSPVKASPSAKGQTQGLAQRPQSQSPVMQKQRQKQGQLPGGLQQQPTTQQLIELAQQRGSAQAQHIARQKEAQSQAQARAQGAAQGRQVPKQNPNPGNRSSGKQDAIVID